MARFAVTLRGYAEQVVYVDADTPAEGREKARQGDFEDVAGYPDWERDEDGQWRHWVARGGTERV